MFGASKKLLAEDQLTVQVHVIGSHAAFSMASNVWKANARTVRTDAATGKEFLHFAYGKPKCTVWLQRDHGHAQLFELIVRWEDQGIHEVYVISDAPHPTSSDQRLQALLHSVLTIPSILPSTQAGVQ